MDTKTLLKLSLMGLLVFSFAATTVHAQDDEDDTEEVAPKKKKAKKEKQGKAEEATRMVVAINKFENKSDAPTAFSRRFAHACNSASSARASSRSSSANSSRLP